jgi:hypothetical protein
VRFRSLRIDGFGRLCDRRFTFGPGLNVVVGPNEAGKSTLAAALVASLYGLQRGEKDRWRPWTVNAYATALTYETADGAVWEVHRAFERDTKGVRVYDADGADAAARIGSGKTVNPGDAQLGISLDVFLQTAYARSRSTAARRTRSRPRSHTRWTAARRRTPRSARWRGSTTRCASSSAPSARTRTLRSRGCATRSNANAAPRTTRAPRSTRWPRCG